MRTPAVLLTGLILVSVGVAQGQQSDIQVEKLGENSYRMVLKSSKSNTVAAGQWEMMSEAQRVCAGRGVRFGRFEFEKLDAVSPGVQSGPLLLRQEIHCSDIAPVPTVPPAVAVPAPTWRPTEELKQQVQSQTSKYFAAKDAGDYKQAYSFLSTTLPLQQWQSTAEKFNVQAGQIRNRTIKKITWYKDPPQAPAPGVYAAVDFSSQFANVDIHCGYLVWHQAQDVRFRLIREEQSYIDRTMQQKLQPNELAAARAKIRC